MNQVHFLPDDDPAMLMRTTSHPAMIMRKRDHPNVRILTPYVGKLGKGVPEEGMLSVSVVEGETCPVRCASCPGAKWFNLKRWVDDPDFREAVRTEIHEWFAEHLGRKLRLRFHVLGDFGKHDASAEYVKWTASLLDEFPLLAIWSFTQHPHDRSTEIARAIHELNQQWAGSERWVVRFSNSSGPYSAALAWTVEDFPPGTVWCLYEKSGGKITCDMCRLCWHKPWLGIGFLYD
jgi:hypothetical protein